MLKGVLGDRGTARVSEREAVSQSQHSSLGAEISWRLQKKGKDK